MIKYLLKCKNKHEFESWFSSSEEYEKLKRNKLIECILCKSLKVEKSIMSPNIAGKKNKNKNIIDSEEFTTTNKNLQKIKKFIDQNFEFVGDKFPRKVRDIYYNNKKDKNIYGTASLKEKEELEEEGIELTSIPWTRDKKN